ncbi:unnamed protein product [Rotaria sp. Silwood2]|nr:unnamed protein product [Rotaria sp. Silwood2]CAF4430918.1 unnamed protein product [Rotaria sp. Silwood2]
MSTNTTNLILSLNNISALLNRYVSIFIFIFGIVGNALNVIVLSQQSLRTSPCSFFFRISSVAGLCSILSGLTTRILAGYAVDLTNTIDWLCKLRIFVLMASRTVALWLIALASIDRWLLSSNKCRYRQMSSLKNAYRNTFITLLFSIMLYAQLIYCYEANLIQTLLKCYGKTELCRTITDFSYALISVIIPITVMITFSLLTMSNVKRSHRRVCIIQVTHMSTNAHNQPQQWRKTDYYLLVMLVIQTVLYCFFTLPQAIQKIYSTMTENQTKSPLQNAIENLAFNILLLLTYFSSGMPFYIYTLCGGKIVRKTLVDVFKKFWTRLTRITN